MIKYPFLKIPIKIKDQYWESDIPAFLNISCITYNHVDVIKQALEGFLMQKTIFKVEVLIHDDASTDGTADILKEYEKRFPQLFKVVYQTENQYSKQIKIGPTYQYPRLQAKYATICEGDDYWIDPDKLQKQVDFLEMNLDYSFCFHNAKVVYMDSKKTTSFANLKTGNYTGSDILREWTVPTASVCYRVSALDLKKMINPNYLYGDIILFLTLAESGKIWCMEETMSVYRRHEGGVSFGKMDINKIQKFIKHHEEIYKNFSGKYKGVQKITLSKLYLGLSLKNIKKQPFIFLKHILKSFLMSPMTFFSETLRYLKR